VCGRVDVWTCGRVGVWTCGYALGRSRVKKPDGSREEQFVFLSGSQFPEESEGTQDTRGLDRHWNRIQVHRGWCSHTD
jgi:hypothetical protein